MCAPAQVARQPPHRRARRKEDVLEASEAVALDVEAVEERVLRLGRVAQGELADRRAARVVAQEADERLDKHVLAVEPAEVGRAKREQRLAGGQQRREGGRLQRGAQDQRALRVAYEAQTHARAQLGRLLGGGARAARARGRRVGGRVCPAARARRAREVGRARGVAAVGGRVAGRSGRGPGRAARGGGLAASVQARAAVAEVEQGLAAAARRRAELLAAQQVRLAALARRARAGARPAGAERAGGRRAVGGRAAQLRRRAVEAEALDERQREGRDLHGEPLAHF